MEETLFIEQVAALIGKAPGSIKYDMRVHPERVPRWFKLPGARKPLWLKSTVEAFLRANAAACGALPHQDVGEKRR